MLAALTDNTTTSANHLDETRNIFMSFTIHNKKKMIVVCLLFFLSMTVLEIWVLNRLATFGEQISMFESRANAISMDNQILGNQIAQDSSLQNLQAAAAATGYQKISQVFHLKMPDLAVK